MATVGYGGLAPTTVVGRLMAVALMLIAVGFFALATVAQRFPAGEVEQVEAAEERVADDVTAAREDVIRELRELSLRLRDLNNG